MKKCMFIVACSMSLFSVNAFATCQYGSHGDYAKMDSEKLHDSILAEAEVDDTLLPWQKKFLANQEKQDQLITFN